MTGGARSGVKKEREKKEKRKRKERAKKEQRRRKDNAEAQSTQSRAESEKQHAEAAIQVCQRWRRSVMFTGGS